MAAASPPPRKEQKDASVYVKFIICLLYGGCSFSMAMLNKTLLSSYEFNGYLTLLVTQLILSIIFCVVSREYFGDPFKIPKMDLELVYKAFPMSLIYVLNVMGGLVGLQIVNVPVYFALRRFGTAVTLLYGVFFATPRENPSAPIWGAVGVIVVGTILVGWENLGSDWLGYAVAMTTNVLTAASGHLAKGFKASFKSRNNNSDLSVFGQMYIQCTIALPIASVLLLLSGEVDSLLRFPHYSEAGFWLGFSICLPMSVLLTYATMLSNTVNGPLTTSITGNAKDILTTLVGWVAFPGFRATPSAVSGIAVGFAGTFWYTFANAAESESKKAKDEAAKSAAAATADGAMAGPADSVEGGGEDFLGSPSRSVERSMV